MSAKNEYYDQQKMVQNQINQVKLQNEQLSQKIQQQKFSRIVDSKLKTLDFDNMAINGCPAPNAKGSSSLKKGLNHNNITTPTAIPLRRENNQLALSA